VATARSNRVAVMLGLQEIPQLKQFYKKEVADTISSIVGNILSGAARDKNTLEWLEKMFGKIKQKPTLNLYLNKEQQLALTKKWIL
jgi:type IV secretory pathway TraG/TraD family ATPase VirD4